jgi:RNA polymerase sigma-70 factor (ECF subfamily)
MNHFLANEWDRARAVKRGGRVILVPLEDDSAEERYLQESGTGRSPEREFERRWALALLDRALVQLRREFAQAERTEQFEALKIFLTGEKPSVSYAELAARMGTTEAALKMAVQRLRRRYGELLRGEIANTVSRPEEIEEELRFLFAAVRN